MRVSGAQTNRALRSSMCRSIPSVKCPSGQWTRMFCAWLSPRRAQSAWEKTGVDIGPGLTRLAEDLRSGAWDARYGDLRRQPEYIGSLRLITRR